MNANKTTFRVADSVETPCIKVCKIDPATRLCTGCHRSLDEIASWGSLSSAERRAIMLKLPDRAKKV